MTKNKKNIEDIKKEIKSLKKDLDNIQANCHHEDHSIKLDSEGKSIRKICNKCDKIIGFPTDDELKDNGFI